MTPFGTQADETSPFHAETLPEHRFHISVDLGGVRFNTKRHTLAEAQEFVGTLESPEGYSSWSVTISEWVNRAVDGKRTLRTVERYWFGELVQDTGERPIAYSPLLDSDGPDYDPEAYVAAANV